MYTKNNPEFIKQIISAIENSKFDNALLDEISMISMIACLTENGNMDGIQLTSDLINSALNMQYTATDLVMTHPLKVIEFSWWYRFIKKYDVKSQSAVEFCQSMERLVNSKVVKNSEISTSFRSTLLINMLGEKAFSKAFKRLNLAYENEFSRIMDTMLFTDHDTLDEISLYYSPLLQSLPNDKKMQMATLMCLSEDVMMKVKAHAIFNLHSSLNVNKDDMTISQMVGTLLVNSEGE